MSMYVHRKHPTINRNYKVIVTLGLMSISVVTIVAPHLVHETAISNLLVNLMWVWGEDL